MTSCGESKVAHNLSSNTPQNSWNPFKSSATHQRATITFTLVEFALLNSVTAHIEYVDSLEEERNLGNPYIQGGGNRVATLLIVLSQSSEGGHTAFPLAKGAPLNDVKLLHPLVCSHDGSLTPFHLILLSLQPARCADRLSCRDVAHCQAKERIGNFVL
jgi:hypothetical protein